MRYLAKPRLLNMTGAKEFTDLKAAVDFLNKVTLNDPSGEQQIKMKARDWMEIGKLICLE